MRDREERHNAHMLIPKTLWDQCVEAAILEGQTMTQWTIAALREKLARRQEGGE